MILPGITIDESAMIGAGAVVTRSVPAKAIVVGNPARIIGYVGAGDERIHIPTDTKGILGERKDTRVPLRTLFSRLGQIARSRDI